MKTIFGTLNGSEVSSFTIENEYISLEVLTLGATIRCLKVKGDCGSFTDVVLGYDSVDEYVNNSGFFGAAVGRFANRIKGSRFTLNGKEYFLSSNEKGNTLHGGVDNFSNRIWLGEEGENFVKFTLISPDGDQGFPGEVKVCVTYVLDGAKLTIKYTATTTHDTPVSLTNHAYFNLAGHNSGAIYNQEFYLNANSFTPTDRDLIPTGEIKEVEKSLDLRVPVRLEKPLKALDLSQTNGFDHNFVLNKGVAATLYSPDTKIKMSVTTSLEAIQIYSGGVLTRRNGKGGAVYDIHHGICLETQHFPNSVNTPSFPSPILRAGEVYDHFTSFEFTKEN